MQVLLSPEREREREREDPLLPLNAGIILSSHLPHLSVGLDLHPLLLQAAVAMRGLCCGAGFILGGISIQKCDERVAGK